MCTKPLVRGVEGVLHGCHGRFGVEPGDARALLDGSPAAACCRRAPCRVCGCSGRGRQVRSRDWRTPSRARLRGACAGTRIPPRERARDLEGDEDRATRAACSAPSRVRLVLQVLATHFAIVRLRLKPAARAIPLVVVAYERPRCDARWRRSHGRDVAAMRARRGAQDDPSDEHHAGRAVHLLSVPHRRQRPIPRSRVRAGPGVEQRYAPTPTLLVASGFDIESPRDAEPIRRMFVSAISSFAAGTF